jgi:hypothetical protein
MLDVATDPQDLPSQIEGKAEVSGAMTRCTNLSLDRMGKASTRKGSSKVYVASLGTTIHKIIEQAGVRYEFVDTGIFHNEVSIATGLTSALWSGIKYNSYNDTTQEILCLNGTDRKRIEGSSVYEWGVDAPAAAPTGYTFGVFYTQAWEAEEILPSATFYTDVNTWAFSHLWEATETPTSVVQYRAGYIAKDWGNLAGGILGTFNWEDAIQLRNDNQKLGQVSGDDAYTITYSWEDDYHKMSQADSSYPLWWFDSGSYSDDIYLIKMTYCRKSGNVLEYESNPSPAFETKIGSSLRIEWTDPTDTSITHLRFYRTLANQADYYYDQEVAVGVGYAELTKRDEALGTELATDHDRPPLGTQVLGPNFDGVCFITLANLLYYCLAKRPEYWPPLNYIEVGVKQYPIMAGAFLGGQLYLATQTDLYQIQGTGSASFFPLPLGASTGTQSKQCFVAIKGQGIYHLGTDGIYRFNVSSDAKISNTHFEPIFRGETAGSIPVINKTYISNCWMIHRGNKLYFGFPGGTDVYPRDVLVLDLTTERTVHYQYNSYIRTATYDVRNDRILAGDSAGYVWELEDPDVTTDDSTAIAWQIETKEFGGLRKYMPRYARYDVGLSTGATASGYVLLDGASKQTHPITESRKTRKRLVTGCTGDRLSVRLSGTGNVDIYGVEVE